MRKILATLLASFACVVASAADTYSIDPDHTHVTFSFQHMGLSTFKGKIPARSGTIVLDRERKTGTVEVVFDPKGIVTGVPKFDDHLRREDFFAVDEHPTATFKAAQISFKGDEPSTISGSLTIKGITKPVTLQVTSFNCGQHAMEKVPACGANATAKIKRSDYGLTYGMTNVPDEIGLEIEVEALQE